MENTDIWRAAQQLIKMYDDGAELAAAQGTDKAIDQGDPHGETVWKQVLRTVQDLQRQKPSASEPLN